MLNWRNWLAKKQLRRQQAIRDHFFSELKDPKSVVNILVKHLAGLQALVLLRGHFDKAGIRYCKTCTTTENVGVGAEGSYFCEKHMVKFTREFSNVHKDSA